MTDPEKTNGVVNARDWEDTPALRKSAWNHIEASASPEDAAEDIASAFFRKMMEGGGSAPPPTAPPKLSPIKSKTIAALVLLIVGPGGGLAVFYAMDNRSKSNQEQVESLAPIVKAHTVQIGELSGDVQVLGDTVDRAMAGQKVIVDGITELKSENIDRLKSELREAKRALRDR